MQKFTLLLVVAALAVAGWQAWEAQGLRDDLQAQDLETSALRADVDRLVKEVASIRGLEAPAPLRTAATPADSGGVDVDEATLAARGASPEVLARRVLELESELEGMRADTARIEEKVDKNPMSRVWKRPKFIRDMESAKKELDLNARQEADIARIVDDTKRELEDLWEIPNEDGKTWKDVSTMKVESGDAGVAVFMSNFAEQQKFKNGTIPGRNETYAQAESRIRDRGKEDVKSVLSPEQGKTFDGAHTDPLFGGSSGGVISFSTVTTSSSSDDNR